MGEEFNMYTSKVQDLGDTIAEKSKSYIEKIEEVTALVNNLSSVWGGPTYDTFLQSYKDNLDNLKELNEVLNNMSTSIGNTASEAESMINTINSNME